MLTFYEWKSHGSIAQLLGQLFKYCFFIAWGLKIEHIFMTFFCVCFFARFLKQNLNKFCSRTEFRTPKRPAHDALTNAYIQCAENKMPVNKAAKLYNIPHTTLRDRLSDRVHIDTL